MLKLLYPIHGGYNIGTTYRSGAPGITPVLSVMRVPHPLHFFV
jgi:hypothetical protein